MFDDVSIGRDGNSLEEKLTTCRYKRPQFLNDLKKKKREREGGNPNREADPGGGGREGEAGGETIPNE